MMTQRLYYEDVHLRSFEATVLEARSVDGRPAVLLDRTAFYPTGGGQLHDKGTIADIPVIDVFTEGDAVVHVLKLDGPPPEGTVKCELDWKRRFNHMQQHTGQHILSAAFAEIIEVDTVGFHLGGESVTIDLDTAKIHKADIDTVEDLANSVVTYNFPVRAWFPTEAELAEIKLRKAPPKTAKLRVVQIHSFDTTACGGTHVTDTGEVGIIKILRCEKRGEKTRVEFRCGRLALLDYRAKNATANTLAAALTVGTWEIVDAVERLRTDYKVLRSAYNKAHTALLTHEGNALLNSAVQHGKVRIIRRAFAEDAGYDKNDLNKLTAQLTERASTIVLLGLAGAKAQLIAACSENLSHDMVAVLKRALAVLETTRGGGRPRYAAGGGVPATVVQLDAALAEAELAVLEAWSA